MLFCVRLVSFACLLAATEQLALADAKFIDVPEAVTAQDVPNPPANEDEAAATHNASGQLPRVLRLSSGADAVRVPKPARSRPPQTGGCACPCTPASEGYPGGTP